MHIPAHVGLQEWLLLDSDAVCGSFYMFYGEDVVALLLGVAGNIVEGFALGEEYFQDVALTELRELNLRFHESHRAMLFRNV